MKLHALVMMFLHITCACMAESHSPLTNHHSPAITLAAVGDILLDRGVAKKITQFGVDYPFHFVAETLSSADIAFGNLECPLSEKGIKVTKPFVFQAKPERVQCLVKAGLDILSLANNHTMDCGRAGLVETMDCLKSCGLRWCGAGSNQVEAEAATVLDVKGIKVAFVGFCQFLPEGVFLRDDKPTIVFASEESVRRAVTAAKKQADIVVASFHWGVEFRSRPTEQQMKWAHVAVEAGADLVLGHHPHVLQGFEVVTHRTSRNTRHSLIAYSLGNFVFDQRPGVGSNASVIFVCRMSKQGIVDAEVLPVEIYHCRPRLATSVESTAILKRLAKLSGELNTVMRNGHIVLASQ